MHAKGKEKGRCHHDERLHSIELLHGDIFAQPVEIRREVGRHISPAELGPDYQQNAPRTKHTEEPLDCDFLPIGCRRTLFRDPLKVVAILCFH